MKKFGKILVLVLSLALALGAFVFTVSANDAPFLVEGLYRYSWAEAIDNAGDDVPVQLLSDYNVAEGESVVVTKSVTIDLGGHKVKSSNKEPLFIVKGEDVTLTITGSGSINAAGTFVKVDGDGASFVLAGADDGITVTATSAATVFEVGGENKGKMSVEGLVNFKAKAASTFASLNSASTLTFNNAKLSLTGEVDASSPVAVIGASSKVVINRSEIYSEIGTLFTVGEGTDIGSPAVLQSEYSTLTANSTTYGTIIDAADAYLTATIRVSTVRASGKAFVAADTMKNVVSGEGANKVYQAPKANVYLTNSVYGLANSVQEGSCVYSGNITGVISGGSLEISKNVIAINTRLWDGENGIYVRVGTRVYGSMSDAAQANKLLATLVSEISEPKKDADEAVIYFDHNSTTNKNFSFETIDGANTSFYVETKINEEHLAETYAVLGIAPKGEYIIDTEWSSNFQAHSITMLHSNGVGTAPGSPAATGMGTRYGSAEIIDSLDGTNRYFRFNYKQQDYIDGKYGLTAASYIGIFVGRGTKGNIVHPTMSSDYMTIDFDFTTDVERDGVPQYPYTTINLIQRPGTSDQYQSTKNLAISGNKLSCGLDANGKVVEYQLPSEVGVWTHVTFVFEINSTINTDEDGNYVSNNLSKSVLHVYVNGEKKGTTTVFSSSADSAKLDTAKLLALDEMRFAFSMPANINASTPDSSLCLDNVVVTHYKNGYSGDIQKVLADKNLKLTDASDVIYGVDYQYPTPNVNRAPVVIVDDVKYYDVQSGISAIGEGSVVELFADVEDVYNAKVGFTVYTNGYNFSVNSTTHYVAPVYGEENVYKISKSNNFVPVYWDVDDYANKDNEGSLYAEMNMPLGMTPAYNDTVPAGSEINGLWREFVGWSYSKGSSTVDELRPITKEDVDRGYVCLYPIYAYTKVKVTFLGLDDQPIGDAVWVNIGTNVSDLINYNGGSDFPVYEVPGLTWYKLGFSGWTLKDSTDTVIGAQTYSAKPEFNRPIITAIKQGFTLTRLTRFAATVYVESAEGVDGVDFIGIYDDYACTAPFTSSQVSISGKTYESAMITLTGFSPDITSGRVDQLSNSVCYVKYKVNGVEYVQEVKMNLEEYLEKLLTREDATNDEKAVALEMMRFVNKSYEMLNMPSSELCDTYLNSSEYKSMLRDLTTVSSLFTDIEKNEAEFEKLKPYIRGMGYDYKNNYIYLLPDPAYYPITTGWATYDAYDIIVYIYNGSDNGRATLGVTEASGGKTSTGKFIIKLNDDSYPDDKGLTLVTNIDSYIKVTYYDKGEKRESKGSSNYRWSNYISFLEANPDADVNELEYARIIYSMHYTIKEATGNLNVAPPVEK